MAVFRDPVTSSRENNKNLVQKEKEQLHLAPLALIIVRPKGRPRRGALPGLQKNYNKRTHPGTHARLLC